MLKGKGKEGGKIRRRRKRKKRERLRKNYQKGGREK